MGTDTAMTRRYLTSSNSFRREPPFGSAVGSQTKAVCVRVAEAAFRYNGCRGTWIRNEVATDQEGTAMRPYSMDLRERVAVAVDEDEGPQREIARLFRVSVSFVSRLLKRRREEGALAPEPHRGGPRRVLGPADRCRLWDLVEDHSDDTLDELRRR